jgi:hypothetical protein
MPRQVGNREFQFHGLHTVLEKGCIDPKAGSSEGLANEFRT